MHLLLFLTCTIFSIASSAADVAGTWKFEKEVGYFGAAKNSKVPTNPVIQIVAGNLILAERCVFQMEKEKFFHGRVFQMLMKGGESEEKLNVFFKRNFSFDLAKSKDQFRITPDNCNKIGPVILVSEDKLIFVDADVFTSYVKPDATAGKLPSATVSASQSASSNMDVSGYKISQLPLNVNNFFNTCREKISFVKNVPQSTAKCAPVFMPYVVTAKDTSPLAKLIGSHNYMPGQKDSDYNNPVQHKLHPLFMLLPSLKDITLVVVIDLEETESRIVMPITYLAIKGGKVTGQTTETCNLSSDFICSDNDGKKLYQLLETGVFKKLN